MNNTTAEFLDALRRFTARYNAINGTNFSVDPWPQNNNIDGLTVSFPSKKERWVNKMAGRAMAAANRNDLSISFHDRITLIQTRGGLTGIAIRNPNDKEDTNLGIALAYCRAYGVPIPDCVM